MCGLSKSNTTGAIAEDVPIPPAALAASLIMIATGIAFVLAYGCGKKRAWRLEKTFVMRENPEHSSAVDEIPMDDLGSVNSF